MKTYHLSPDEFVAVEVSSTTDVQVRVAYIGQVPDTDKASIAIEVRPKQKRDT